MESVAAARKALNSECSLPTEVSAKKTKIDASFDGEVDLSSVYVVMKLVIENGGANLSSVYRYIDVAVPGFAKKRELNKYVASNRGRVVIMNGVPTRTATSDLIRAIGFLPLYWSLNESKEQYGSFTPEIQAFAAKCAEFASELNLLTGFKFNENTSAAYCFKKVARHLGLSDDAGLAEADDARHVERSLTQAAFVAAAVQQRLQAHARFAATDIERADALRPIDLVRGQRQQIDAERLHVDRLFA